MFQEIGVVMHVESLEIAASREAATATCSASSGCVGAGDLIPLFMRLVPAERPSDVAAILEAFRIWENNVSDEEMREVTSKAQLPRRTCCHPAGLHAVRRVGAPQDGACWRPTPYGLYRLQRRLIEQ